MRARHALVVLAALGMLMSGIVSAAVQFPEVGPGAVLQFPRDHGAHSTFRNEWWYITGWLKRPNGSPLGFQVTFFRFRPGIAEDNPSAFAPKQVLFVHAAVSDPATGKLLHQERVYRGGFGLAQASIADADVRLRNWLLQRSADGVFHTVITGKDFALDLSMSASQPVLLEGDNGYSRKGQKPGDASYYYSIPHLNVAGRVTVNGQTERVTGTAWLDREWSSSYLDRDAAGWDWVGLNLDDGGALMAFRIRDKAGNSFWAGGTLRDPDGATHVFAPGDLQFAPVRHWRSPQTGAEYPVETIIRARLPSGEREWHLTPLFDNQEYDARAAAGPVYWEGAVRTGNGTGYLELTGYFHPLNM